MSAYKADFIFYDLLSKIYQKYYKEGKLPTQRNLAKSYNVSRFTIQSVLNRLQNMGIIHTIQGDGIYIDHSVLKNPLMLNSMIERPYEEIESKMVYLRKVPANHELSSIFSISLGDDLWEYQRIRIVNYQITQLQTSWIPCYLVCDMNKEVVENSIYDYILSLDYKIGHTISKYKAVAVDNKTASLLQCKKNTPAMSIESRGLLRDRTIFEYSNIICLDYGCTYIVPFNKKLHGLRHKKK
ncbi:GntR family transcriptional regulator [Mediterraneibacter agrestimuris]|uniref:GntR family transcriptional regulator n=1 Tax=Mediterraneibacter agrestimuris TaxID=2941333 RepID=UPI002040AFDA|nr:GntR family transcriptional regulator [Mediterraneibacter agrestimuris]